MTIARWTEEFLSVSLQFLNLFALGLTTGTARMAAPAEGFLAQSHESVEGSSC